MAQGHLELDFVADGRPVGVSALTVIDLVTRECLAIDVGHGLSGRDVVATLERLRFERGLPQRIYCDNGLPQKSQRRRTAAGTA